MSRVIACREMLSGQEHDTSIVYDRWSFYYSGRAGAEAIGIVRPVRGGWQAETEGSRPLTMPVRPSRLAAAQDVLDHHTGDCSCTPSGWLCPHGPEPEQVDAPVIEPQPVWAHQREGVARLLSPGEWWNHPGAEDEKARALAKADEVIAYVLGGGAS